MAQESIEGKSLFNGKAILNYGFKVVQELLGLDKEETAKKVTLNEIKMEDVQRGKIRLEHKQNTVLAELKEIEGQKRRLFSEGVQKAGVREQKVLALKIKQLDMRMRNQDRMLEAIYIQMRVIDNFIMIKEQEQLNKEMGLQSIFGDMDMNELIVYMEQAMVDGQLNMTMMRDLADNLDKRNYMGEVLSDDEDIQEIMRQMQMAREAADSPDAIDVHYAEMDEKLTEKTQDQPNDEADLFEDEF